MLLQTFSPFVKKRTFRHGNPPNFGEVKFFIQTDFNAEDFFRLVSLVVHTFSVLSAVSAG